MIRAPTSPLMAALAAVTAALGEYRVHVVRHSASAALHRLSYDLAGDTIAAVGWCDGMFVDPEIPPELDALVRAHAHLACAAPSAAVQSAPTCSPSCSHPYLEA